MNKTLTLILVLLITSGFIGANSKTMSEKEKNKQIGQIRQQIDRGQYYQAGQSADRLLRFFPEDPQVRELSTQVQAKQTERYESLRGSLAGANELTSREKQDAIQTLVERAEAFYAAGNYREAADTAQEVFQYEPGNARASKLMDKISSTEMKLAQDQDGLLREVYRDEMTERMDAYRKEARQALDDGRFGRARFALEKMLLLEPNDPEANRLYETVLHQLEKKAA